MNKLRDSIWQKLGLIISLATVIVALFVALSTLIGSSKSLLSSPAWQLIGIIIAIGSLVLSSAIFFVQRQISKKELSYSIISNIPLINEESLSNRITILFDNQPLDNAQILTLKIWNSGTIAIAREDYVQPLAISFGEKALILDLQIIETIPKIVRDLVEIKIENNTLLLLPVLLNSRDEILLRLILTNYIGNIKIIGLLEGADVKKKV